MATAKSEARNVNINKAYVTGRLVSDTENVKLESGRVVTKGRIAVSRTVKGKEHTSFVDIEMFSENGMHLKKGQQVFIDGRIIVDEWKDENENYHSKTKIQAFKITSVGVSGNDINHIMISGRLVKDPVVAVVSEGRSVLKMRVAVNRRYEKNGEWKEITEFVDVVHFGTTEYIAKLAAKLSKGKFIYIQGRLHQESWKNSEGENRSRIVVVAEQINLSNIKKSENTQETEKEEKEKPKKKTTAKKNSQKSKKKEKDEYEEIEKEIEELDVDGIETPF
ncbi:single-stranded DNA-binding protein [Persephonella sp. KM09-Lau-8]|uniref:single-stranded DNA-binding protein n=1 Tax=Persephonella sp. KM09-Lau-8 TaxID=1158345 RepID=UPI00068C3057|nr:single-stranded DNA-binding protein [Persephonella sp. KM09-Lau-8]